MVIVCRGICPRYSTNRKPHESRYLSGQKRCNSCELFMKWDGIWCPCCNHRLRLAPGMENIKKNIFTQWQKEKVNLKLEFDFSKSINQLYLKIIKR